MKLKNLIKISKGILFIAVGILFLYVVFYDIQFVVDYDGKLIDLKGYEIWVQTNAKDYFKETILNYAFSALFIVLGILEIGEVFTNE